jgi:transcriptional accessory protein Tex/SPT6
VKEYGAFVTLLPGANGLVHKSEVDWGFVSDPAEFVQPGQHVGVKILSLEPDRARAELSIKAAHGVEPRPAVALVDGGPPFLEGDGVQAEVTGQPELEGLRSEISRLRDELEAERARRAALEAELGRLRKP